MNMQESLPLLRAELKRETQSYERNVKIKCWRVAARHQRHIDEINKQISSLIKKEEQ